MINRIEANGIQIVVEFKKIKNLHLRILSAGGLVRVSAPKQLALKHIHAFVLSKLAWIKRHQERIAACNHQLPLRYEDAEIHQVWGQPCRLCIVEIDHARISPPKIPTTGSKKCVSPYSAPKSMIRFFWTQQTNRLAMNCTILKRD
ncbi:MAG TPA: DUF45 domain-containing protein [Desulfonatronum sp.]|nr:DUF45 domain-containing protein [Desulfonatronum sp.]